MKRQIAASIVNCGLMVGVVAILAGPVVLGQMLSSANKGTLGAEDVRLPGLPSGSGGASPSAGPTAGGFAAAIYPNTTDFGQYASFSAQPLVSSQAYQTAVTFSEFPGQQASYNGLLSIVNTSKRELRLTLEGGTISGLMSQTRVWLSLVPDGMSPVTLVTEAASAGDQTLNVADATGLAGQANGEVVVGTDVHQASEASPTTLRLASGLAAPVGVGEKVYIGPVFYFNANSPLLGSTEVMTLKPGAKALVNMVVAMDGTPNGSGAEASRSEAVLPLVVRAQF